MTDKKNILITGAAKRIGRHLALSLAKAGYGIALHFHKSEDAALSLQQEIHTLGQSAECFQCDLADEQATVALFGNISAKMQPPSILINNASIFEEDNAFSCDAESWNRHQQINLRAPLILSQALEKSLSSTAKGHIINIIDQRVLNLTPHYFSYSASKSGLWTLTQTLAMSFAPNIQVNAIGPGPTLPNQRQTAEDFQSQWESLPLGQKTPLEDISNAIKFLLKNSSMTGQMIALDSGEHLGWAQPNSNNQPRE